MSDSRASAAEAEHLIVFPNPAQLAAASRAALDTGTPLTAVLAPGVAIPAEAPAGVTLLSAEQVAARTQAPAGARVMCGHESGVYWVAEHRRSVGQPNFAETCLRMLVKTRLAAELVNAGVTVAPKWPLPQVADPLTLPYPLVAKPNFGFASMLVKRIPDAAALSAYRRDYDRLRQRSLLTEYDDFADRCTDADPAEVIVEPDLTASTIFLTVPFLVHGGTIAGIFPIRGEGQRHDDLTDFHWNAFRYGEVPDGAVTALHRDLPRLVDAFALTGGVYEVEALYDETADVLYVLEFSPRVTGGFIPELVRRSTGVDLDFLGILYFLGAGPVEPPPIPSEPHLLILRPVDEEPPAVVADLRRVATRRRRLGGADYVDEIYRGPQPDFTTATGDPGPAIAPAPLELVAFEGLDGTGKTRMIRLLAEALGVPRTTTPGPEYTDLRQALHATGGCAPFLMYLSACAWSVEAASLAGHRSLLIDRYWFSSAVQHGWDRQLSPEGAIDLISRMDGLLTPAKLTILLSTARDVRLRRLHNRAPGRSFGDVGYAYEQYWRSCAAELTRRFGDAVLWLDTSSGDTDALLAKLLDHRLVRRLAVAPSEPVTVTSGSPVGSLA
jgi:thymidylate kinase